MLAHAHSRQGYVIPLIFGMLCVALVGAATYWLNGLGKWRFDVTTLAALDHFGSLHQREFEIWTNPKTAVPCFQLNEPWDTPKADFFMQHGCLVRHPGKRAVLLMGDSHSASIGVGLREWAQTQDFDFLHAAGFLDPRIYCHNMPSRQQAMACNPDYNRTVMQQLIAAKPDVLVLDMHWAMPGVLEAYPDRDAWVTQIQFAVQQLTEELGVKKVILIGQIPTWKNDLPTFLLQQFARRGRSIPKRTFEGIDDTSLQMEAKLKQAAWPANTMYFSMADVLCNNEGCLTRIGNDWRTDLIVWDYGHLTAAGSRYITTHGLATRILEALKS